MTALPPPPLSPHSLLAPSPIHEHGSRWSAVRAVIRTASQIHARVEVHTLDALAKHVAEKQSLHRVTVVGLDLREKMDQLCGLPASESVFFGCVMSANLAAHIVTSGGMVFPSLDIFPYKPFRTAMYTSDELMAGYDPAKPA